MSRTSTVVKTVVRCWDCGGVIAHVDGYLPYQRHRARVDLQYKFREDLDILRPQAFAGTLTKEDVNIFR